MPHELTAYLADFEEGLKEAPSRFAATPSLPSSPSLPSFVLPSGTPGTTTAAPPASGTEAFLPGSTALRPLLQTAVRLWVSNVPGWQTEMREGAAALTALQRDAAARRAQGVDRSAEAVFRREEVHLTPNYVTREFPVPRDGVCNLKLLAWVDVWQAAQALLRKFAAMPPVGTPGADVLAWVRNIHAARRLMFESANLREAFFDIVPSAVGGSRSGVVYQGGLASDRQAGGVYDRPARPASVTLLTAMDYAPRPYGGYQELMGSALRQRAHMWWTTLTLRPDGQVNARVGDEQGLAGEVLPMPGATGPAVGQPRALHTALFENAAWVSEQVALLWGRASSASPYTTTRIRDTSGTNSRRWRAYDVTVDVGSWIRNAYDYAAYFGDPRLSFAEVMLRTTGFYLNSYLDYAKDERLVPREDIAAAQAQYAVIQAQARMELRLAIYTAVGLISAVVSLIPVVGVLIGGLLSGITALLVELGGMASGGAFLSPVLPLYSRGYAGSCREAVWIEPPAPGGGGPGPAPDDGSGGPPAATGSTSTVIIGAGAVAFGLWLLSRAR